MFGYYFNLLFCDRCVWALRLDCALVSSVNVRKLDCI